MRNLFSNRLLTSGWWAYSRKPVRWSLAFSFFSAHLTLLFLQNYVADWTMSLMWGAVVGTASIIPYFYCVFFIVVLIHRCGRDFERYESIMPFVAMALTSYSFIGALSSMEKTGSAIAQLSSTSSSLESTEGCLESKYSSINIGYFMCFIPYWTSIAIPHPSNIILRVRWDFPCAPLHSSD